MKRLQQLSANTCGQTCLAMLTGDPVSEILKEIPDSPVGTDSSQLRQFLKRRGYRVSELESLRPLPKLYDVPSTGLIRVRWGEPSDRRAHWVLLHECQILDPLAETPLFLSKAGGRILSYFEVS
jgi:hypothetical protein